jgi:sec-independent protein translocase protein TatB
MLDIGFSELVVIGVVALLVVGPERLPRVARTAGHLLGRFQRYVADVKADINREIELSELKKIQSSVEDAARSIEHTVKSEMQQADQELRSVESELNQAGEQLQSAHSDVQQSLSSMSAPSPHMGTALSQPDAVGAGAASPDQRPLPGIDSAPPEQPDEPSPQLELGLGPSLPPAPHQPSPSTQPRET